MYEEVEWFTEELEYEEKLKQALWDDELFKEYVEEFGITEALWNVTNFHMNISSQLRSQGATDVNHSDWARRAIPICIRAKSRRQQLRQVIRASMEDGHDIVSQITEEVKAEWND